MARSARGVEGVEKRGTGGETPDFGIVTESRGREKRRDARRESDARLGNCAERSEGTGSARPRAVGSGCRMESREGIAR